MMATSRDVALATRVIFRVFCNAQNRLFKKEWGSKSEKKEKKRKIKIARVFRERFGARYFAGESRGTIFEAGGELI